MGRGRPPLGPKLVDGLDAPEVAKERARIILATIAGDMGVAEACAKLQVEDARFHAMRKEALAGMLDALAPRPRGRPSHAGDPKDQAIAALERSNLELKADLKAEELRTEIALTMPHLLTRKAARAVAKKKSRHPATRGQAR